MTPRWVHYYCVVTSLFTLFLLSAGALVTGTGSGLAVPDWPLSFGQLFPPMIGGVFYEHGHRMVAGTTALLTLGMAGILHSRESRRAVRNLGFLAVLIILIQATLGGLTVLLKLPKSVSISHACLGQIFFCLTVIIAVTTSPSWFRYMDKLNPSHTSLHPLALGLSILFFVQLLLGATVRHNGAGLAIPDFPLSFGRFFPPLTDFSIAIHFSHRIGAFIIVGTVALLIYRVLANTHRLDLTALTGVIATFVCIQIILGALIIWGRRPIPMTTLHLVGGAVCLASSVTLTLLTWPKRGSEFIKRGVLAVT